MTRRETPAPVRLGRIGYLNVLPIYHPLETRAVDNDFVVESGPPAKLNTIMEAGGLDLSACSSIEYARRPERYLLVPDLAIGSCGPVQSVLLLSRVPLDRASKILVSAQTHTSAALLRLMLATRFGLRPDFETGDIRSRLAAGEPPQAFLAIGDEALRLRRLPDYPYALDLGSEWNAWTGLPFIFGVWIVRREAAAQLGPRMDRAVRTLLAAKAHGAASLPDYALLGEAQGILDAPSLRSYFRGLVYDLGPEEQEGLCAFYAKLAEAGAIPAAPRLEFYQLRDVVAA
ncbi:menaquinone biosynthetic enzyme MqnA/MqnD family protein [Desulfocurvibacter africanus]|uniref:Chorismate dehydratase n=1 Tax=Desulfocurvibacter africanus subsp. africanus str. Walvis Bay TaxID=690850 RepID=F3Z1U8_DESAF|nr:menaquinone biosynthesis protein [Desulfocurvibacter africanus]EGJ50056.1 protein of unknown function DUF178 [Desulfocurvibacter africanus subsp. africanus str. Walvis Bay]